MRALLRAGVPVGSNYLLTVPGRKSGRPRTTPVTVVAYEGERWLTSPFGQVDWVRNLRAAGGATLHRGRRAETLVAREVSAAEAAPLLKWLLTETKLPSAVRSQYLVPPDAPLAGYEEEARHHPVFRLSAAPAA
jgi:deazaflavin-dependent oxidoreductase (nitroreductase family)